MADWDELLESDLAWREAELAALKLHLVIAPESSIVRKTLLRALWTMLYAHFEGFCKYAWDVYLDGIEASGLRREQLVEQLARFSLSRKFSELRGDTSLINLYHFCNEQFPALMRQRAVFADRLDKDSNLTPDRLRENCGLVGLPCEMVQEHEATLRTLLSRRNGIAHGRKMYVESFGEYSKYEKAAMLVMHELAIAIVETFERAWYTAAKTAMSE